MNNLLKVSLKVIPIALCMGAVISACTKTEVVPYEEEPANRITGYKVTNAPEVIYGAVDNADNSITVTVPYYLSINYIVPEITLEEGATLIDKQGDPIDIREDLEPVPFDSVGYTYRVKDKNNTIRQYTLVTKISPHVDPLKLGYSLTQDANGNYIADDTAPAQALVNSQLVIYGNFESSSKNGKLTLISQKTKQTVPNGLQLVNVARAQLFHLMTLQISPQIDSGYYHIVVEHQGRIDTLPSIHLTFQRPFFQWLNSSYATGDTVTLDVVPNSGVNTGIKRIYTKFKKIHYDFPGTYLPAGFPKELFDVPIELPIISQSRTQVKFKLPDIPVGKYSTYIYGGTGNLIDTGFGFYFDFETPEWGKDQLLSSAPYTFEVTAR